MCYNYYNMTQARPDLISCFWENPPGPNQGLTLVRTMHGRDWEAFVPPDGSLTQIEAAAVLGVTLMSVNRYVRSGMLKDRKEENGISMIPLDQIKRFLRQRQPKKGRKYLTG